jgi:glucose-1-phosphate adenylyltransferase
MDTFSSGFVEILAAEQTPESTAWFQGTADAVRKAARHFAQYDADYYLILAGDHLYRMDYAQLLDAHVDRQADVTIAALPVNANDAHGMGIFTFDWRGAIQQFEEKPNAERLAAIGRSAPEGSTFMPLDDDKPFVASMGIYVFSRQTLLDVLEQDGIDFGKEIIPAALGRYRVHAFLHRDYWADVGTIDAYYDANIMLTRPDPPFRCDDPRRPLFTHPRHLPPARVLNGRVEHCVISDGCSLYGGEFRESVIGVRSVVRDNATITRSVLVGADFYETDEDAAGLGPTPRLGIGRDVVIDRAIIDKNARIGDGCRLVNESGVQEADGDGWHIRSGIIVVPKGGVIKAGTVV